MFKNMKLGVKLMLTSVALTAVGIVILVAVLLFRASELQEDTAEALATENARTIAASIKSELEKPLFEAQGIAFIFERIDAYIRENRRKRLNTVLKHILERNEEYLGVWTCWEPNALDTLDELYKNTPGHDATGRFIPYWNRGSGKVQLEALVDYDKEGAGDYYLLAKKAQKEVIVNPYKYVAGGKELLITSVVTPIFATDGSFMGVVGIDIELKNIQKIITEMKIGETGYCYLISNDIVINAHPKTDFVNGKVKDIEVYTNEGDDRYEVIESHVKEGKEIALVKYSAVSKKQVYRTYVPLFIGNTGTPWSLAVNQDMDEILEPVRAMTMTSIIIGIIVLAIICAILYYLMNNLTKTIDKLKERLQKTIGAVLDGRLDFRADTKNIHQEFLPVMTGLNDLMDAFVQPINVTAEYVDRISKGDLPPKITDDYKGDFNEIKNNLNTLIDSLSRFLADMSEMHKQQVAGEIDHYLDPAKFTGFYREMGVGVNEGVKLHVDNILLILNILKAYSVGELSPTLKKLPGKQIIANDIMDKLRNTLLNLIDELNKMSASQKAGDYEALIDAGKFEGSYFELADGINAMIDNINDVVLKSFKCMAEYGEGNLESTLERFPGKRAVANHIADTVKSNIQGIVDEVSLLINAAIEGKLDKRGDSRKFSGAFADMVNGFNKTLDAVIGPLNVAAEYVDRIAKGDIPPKISDDYHGDFNEIKNNLNQLIDIQDNLISELDGVITAVTKGRLDKRAKADMFVGGWGEIIMGMNNLVDAFVRPINVTAEYVDRIAKGDIPPKITDTYHGDFNEIKNNLNGCIDAVKLLVSDTVMLSNAAIAGDFDKRAETAKHLGDFRRIVDGINGTLDNIVDKVFWFEQLLDSMPNPISVTDMNMNWTFLNKAAESVTGFNRKEIIGKHCSNWNADICNTEKCGITCLKRGQNTSFFLQPGLDMYFQVDAHYITNAKGEKIGHIEVVQDITKQKKVEIQQEDARRKAENVMAYQTNEAEKLIDALTNMMNGNLNFDLHITDGGDDTMEVQEIFSQISETLKQTIKAIKNLTADTIKLADAAGKGNLQYRANASSYKGEYKAIIEGFNNTLDAVIEPMNEAGNVLSIMATGDLTARMEGDYKGDLLELKTNINTLGDSLQNLIARVSDNVSQSASAAIEISSTAESLAASAQEQSAQADEVSSAVEEMSRTVTENAQSANRTADVAQRNGKVAVEGGGVVERTVEKMRDIALVVKNSAENIQKLGESSKQIGEIISVIDEIADQTNLLALNAAIEAARAGEQGRGFAVVADEVRKLAERTTEATKQIAKMIKGIQEETGSAVIAMNKGNEEVKSGIELADQAGRSLHEILSSTQEVLDMINQIAAASEEQSATSEQISKNVLSISRVTAESAKRIEDVAHSADNLSKMTEQLTELMSHFKIDDGDGYTAMKSPIRRVTGSQKKSLPARR